MNRQDAEHLVEEHSGDYKAFREGRVRTGDPRMDEADPFRAEFFAYATNLDQLQKLHEDAPEGSYLWCEPVRHDGRCRIRISVQ